MPFAPLDKSIYLKNDLENSSAHREKTLCKLLKSESKFPLAP